MHVSQVEPCAKSIPFLDDRTRIAQIACRIGGITIGLFAPAYMQLTVDPETIPFCTGSTALDVRVEVNWADDLKMPNEAPLFDSGGLWSLVEESGGYCFYFRTSFLGETPYKTARFDSKFRRGQVGLLRRYFDQKAPVNPLEYPLDELLAIHRLSLGEGVEVHALGVVDELGRGHLFVGHSGAGKSTSARLWQKRPGARVLSDDRIILRREDGRTRMYGTPWHGDAGLALAESADLSGIYILAHGTHNRLSAIPAGRAAAEVFARSFVPYHSAEGLASTLEILDHITREAPCSRFEFVPDQRAVEAICRA